MNEYVEHITYNCDNLEVLKIVKYLINVVINDIELMNDLANEEDSYDLGNNYIIKSEDLESLISITDTINSIVEYNEE